MSDKLTRSTKYIVEMVMAVLSNDKELNSY